MSTKKCKICNINKSLDEFHVHKDGRGKEFRRNMCKECRNESKRKYQKNYILPPKSRWAKYKRDAIRRNIEFKLTVAQFISFDNSSCIYCGDDLDVIRLDRVDNNLGYTIDNVAPCCYRCNFLKGELKQNDFLEHVEKIASFQQTSKEQKISKGKEIKDGKQKNIIKKAGEGNAANPERISPGGGFFIGNYLRRINEWGRGFFSRLW